VSVASGSTRYFNGIVSSFGYAGSHGRHVAYHATLRPWLWLLSQASDCRIFQRMSVPDVVRQVFRYHGCSDYKLTLNGDYPERDYIVQYRETTLRFVQRLLEQEGMYYYFKHEASRHSLEIVDSMTAHSAQADYEKVPFFPPGRTHQEEYIEHWSVRRGVPSASILVDLCTRAIVGWAVSRRCDTELTLECLNRAVAQHPPGADLLHHTDRGSAYPRRRTELCELGMVQSMSRRGKCSDNAVAESTFSSTKDEPLRSSTR
jgi:hypothetical protein